MSFQLSDQQGSAVSKIGKWFKTFTFDQSPQVFRFEGVAGSGKSSIMPNIVDGLGVEPEDIAFVAPTGKAARIMSNKLKEQGITGMAKTIHSTFYLPNAHRVEVLEKQLTKLNAWLADWTLGNVPETYEHLPAEIGKKKLQSDIRYIENELDDAYEGSPTPKFSLNIETNARYAKLIVVDEASMVGTKIAEDLKTFNIPILAIGDSYQLPPVQDTPGFLIGRPDAALTEIHRQAEGNPILWLSKLVREGKQLPLGTHGTNVKVVRRREDDVTLNMDRDAMVICGTHKKKWTLTNKIREAAGYHCEGPQEGEPLIIKKNSKKIDNFFNGDFCVCAEDVPELKKGTASFLLKTEMENGEERSFYAYQAMFERFYLRDKLGASAGRSQSFKAAATSEHLEFGHVITCHSSQGSQWPDVVVHDESGVFGDDSSKWLYVGVTRSSDKLTVVV